MVYAQLKHIMLFACWVVVMKVNFSVMTHKLMIPLPALMAM